MAELKTQANDASVADFLAAVEPPQRRADAQVVCDLMAEVTGEPPVMWGPAIVGFGRYTYRNAAGKPGDWMRIGFSPRKANLTLYFISGFDEHAELLARLGKHKTSVSCVYVKRLADIDLDVLRELAEQSVALMRARYPSED